MSLEPPNYTLIIQFLFFLTTIYVLTRFVFNPILKTIEERRQKTVQTLDNAQLLLKEAAQNLSEYHSKITQHKEYLKKMKEDVRQQLVQEASERIEKLRQEFLGTMQDTKKNIANQLSKAESLLSADVKALSQEIFKKFSKSQT